MVVSSLFPGRIRLRSLLLQDADICAALKTALEQQPAVHKVEYSTHTGSILIEYESDKLPIKKLHALKDELAELKQRKTKTCRFKTNPQFCRTAVRRVRINGIV